LRGGKDMKNNLQEKRVYYECILSFLSEIMKYVNSVPTNNSVSLLTSSPKKGSLKYE